MTLATRERILVVDDEEPVRRTLSRVLGDAGYRHASAATAEGAHELFAAGDFALVLCDIKLPEGSGLALTRTLLAESPDTAVVMITGIDDPDVAEEAFSLGAFGYLVKPFDGHELLIAVRNALTRRELEASHRAHSHSLERLVQLRTTELLVSREETIERLARAVAVRDGETGAHVERMGRYCNVIARRLGLGEELCELIRTASPLHDVGKIGIPDGILRKRGTLTARERKEMEKHAELGHEILAGSYSRVLRVAANIAYTHHERVDGTGYPRGLAGDEIPVEGRVAAVGDVFDALTSNRVYRGAMTHEKAIGLIEAGRGTQFDPEVLDAFMAVMPEVEQIRGQADPRD